MNKPAEHVGLISKPSDQKSIDRLDTMFKTVRETARQAQSCLLSCAPIDGRQEIAPGILVIDLSQPQKFQGLEMCLHCMADASLSLRDLANLIDDMVTEAKKHKVDE